MVAVTLMNSLWVCKFCWQEHWWQGGVVHYLLLCRWEMFLDGEVREFFPLPVAAVFPPLPLSLPFLLVFSRMLWSCASTSPKYGRLAGSPSQQFCISCQHGSLKTGNFSGRNPCQQNVPLVWLTKPSRFRKAINDILQRDQEFYNE